MKSVGNWGSVCAILAIFMASCFEPPQYSVVPEIIFEDIIFRDLPNPSDADSLIISIKFKDGDGDLGFTNGDTIAPFNSRYYFRISDASKVPSLAGIPVSQLITYKTRRTVVKYDTLPAFIPPYNCINWEIRSVNKKLDTFYIQLNPNHYNIRVNWYVQNLGVFTEFDWRKEYCTTFDGRFPLLSKDLSRKTPLDGTIHYAMKSVGFLLQFSTKTLKLKVTIQDRALNRSNSVESKPFTLQSIRKTG